MTPDPKDILSQCPMFRHVTGASAVRLAAMARVCHFAKDTQIFRQGTPPPGVYIVASGLVRVYKLSANGKQHILHLVGRGSTFAEVAAIGNFPVPAFAQAVEDSTCVLLPQADFLRALQEDHQLCLQLLGSLAGWVRHLVGLMEDIVLRDAAGRVAKYLLEHCTKTATLLPIAKKDLANHLNLTSETLSRTLRRLDDAGVIIQSEAGIAIANREELELIIEGLGQE